MQNKINASQKGKKSNTQKRVGYKNNESVNPFEKNQYNDSNKFEKGENFVPASMQHDKNDMKDNTQGGLSQIFYSNSSMK